MGYTAPCSDWNSDGLIDLVSSDNSASPELPGLGASDGSLNAKG